MGKKKEKVNEIIEYNGLKYSNEPTIKYTKVGKKPSYVDNMPEYHKTEHIIWQIEQDNNQLEKIPKWIKETDKWDTETLTELYNRQAHYQIELKTSKEELKKRRTN